MRKPFPDPPGHIHTDRVANEMPSHSSPKRMSWKGPIGGEARHTFCVDNVRKAKLTGRGEPDSGWRRDTQSRTALDRWHGILGPTQAPEPLCPIEAIDRARHHWSNLVVEFRCSRLVRKEHFAWVVLRRRKENYPHSTLGNTKAPRVNNPVCPPEPVLLKPFGQMRESHTAIETEHV